MKKTASHLAVSDREASHDAVTHVELSNVDVAVYALFRLGGSERKVHTEEIAYEAYLMAKERFGWKLERFRKMGLPDKEPVRSALMDAAKEKYGSLVEGRSGADAKGKETDGWRLTPAGAAWLRAHKDRIECGLGQVRPQTRTVDSARFRRQMISQSLFQKFAEKGNIDGESQYALTDMLNTSPDSPRDVVFVKFQRLRSTAELVGDSEILRFLDACISAFPHLLQTDTGQDGERSEKQ
jgi:hypothetical protein